MGFSVLTPPRFAGRVAASVSEQPGGVNTNGNGPTRLAALATLPLRGRDENYLIACGLIGEPVPPVMISGVPQKKNS